MGPILTLIALGLSLLALAYAGTRGGKLRAPLSAELRSYIVAAVVVLIAGALLTLPTGKPWSGGQTLAPGFLLGGAAVLAAGLLAGPGMGLAGGVATATLGVSALLFFYARQLLDPLGGFMLGAVSAGALLGGGLLAERDDPAGQERTAAVEFAVLACVAVASAVYLATFHRSPTGVREWQALPVFLSGVLSVALAGSSTLRRSDGSTLVPGAALLLPVGLIAFVIGWRLNGTAHFWQITGVGVVLFGLVGWLGQSRGADVSPASNRGFGLDAGLVSALLVLGGAAIAFRWLHGYGIALLLLAGLTTAGLLPSAASREALRGALGFGLLVLLYRVFTERTGYAKGLELDFIYSYVALVLGALFTPVLLQLLPEPTRRSDSLPRLLRLGLMGAVAALLPLAVWLLFGDRAQAALLVGLAVGAAFLSTRGSEADGAPIGRVLAVGAALSALQFTHLLADAGARTRTERVIALAVIGAALAVWLGAVHMMERKRGVG